MNTVVAPVSLLNTSKLSAKALAAINGNATATGKLFTNVATPRRPECSLGTAQRAVIAAFRRLIVKA
jgi:hypothetical protein